MNIFEKVLVDILTAGVITAPIFVKSTTAVAALNVSDEALVSILQGMHSTQQGAVQQGAVPTLNVPAAPGALQTPKAVA